MWKFERKLHQNLLQKFKTYSAPTFYRDIPLRLVSNGEYHFLKRILYFQLSFENCSSEKNSPNLSKFYDSYLIILCSFMIPHHTLTRYDTLADHSKSRCEILYDYYGVILWADVITLVGKTGFSKCVMNMQVAHFFHFFFKSND